MCEHKRGTFSTTTTTTTHRHCRGPARLQEGEFGVCHGWVCTKLPTGGELPLGIPGPEGLGLGGVASFGSQDSISCEDETEVP